MLAIPFVDLLVNLFLTSVASFIDIIT